MTTYIIVILAGFVVGMIFGTAAERVRGEKTDLYKKIADLEEAAGREIERNRRLSHACSAYQMKLAEARLNAYAGHHRIDCPVAFLADTDYACQCGVFKLKNRNGNVHMTEVEDKP